MLVPSGRRASSRCIPGHRTRGSPGQERQYRSSNLLDGADIVTDQDKYGKAEKNDNGRLTSEDRERHRHIDSPGEVRQDEAQPRREVVCERQVLSARQGECRYVGGHDERVEDDRRYGCQPELTGSAQTSCEKGGQRGHTGTDNDVDEAKRGKQVGDKATDDDADDCLVEQKWQQDQSFPQPELHGSVADGTEGWHHCEDDIHRGNKGGASDLHRAVAVHSGDLRSLGRVVAVVSAMSLFSSLVFSRLLCSSIIPRNLFRSAMSPANANPVASSRPMKKET